jgi:hypothetical protein
MIQTTIGDGNRFNDLSCLWFPFQPETPPCGDEAAHRQFAVSVGLTVERFVPITEGEQSIQSAIVEALLSRPPKPMIGDAIKWIVELSGHLTSFDSKKQFINNFTQWISNDHSDGLTEWQRQSDSDLVSSNPSVLAANIDLAFTHSSVVVERSPPTAESIMSLLSKGSGVAFGAFLGFHVAQNASPLFLFAAVPGGMLLCCTAAGVADALQLGLRHRVLSWLVHAKRDQQEVSAGRALDFFFSRSESSTNDQGAPNKPTTKGR